MKPLLLDLYCGAGGATRGYQLAGFEVVGVDINPQPHYCGDEFHQGDALEWLDTHDVGDFAAIHASPPCQRYSACQRIRSNEHPDLIGPTRALLEATGLPWVIENVEEARRELRSPVLLCGAMFSGLHTYRHRLFEASFPLAAPLHPAHGQHSVKMGRPLREGDWYHAVGNFSNVAYVRTDLGVEWMNRDGIRECIPPGYTEHVGTALMSALELEEAS